METVRVGSPFWDHKIDEGHSSKINETKFYELINIRNKTPYNFRYTLLIEDFIHKRRTEGYTAKEIDEFIDDCPLCIQQFYTVVKSKTQDLETIKRKFIEEIDICDWHDVMTTNVTGVFLTCKIVLPYMKQNKSGKIVNVSSIAGRHRSPVSGVHYVASKAAIIGFTRQLAFEVAPFGINANTHCPSQTLTPMLRSSMSPEQIEQLEATIPLHRLASVEEQAGTILFLCSDASSYMSGAILDVNGGQI